MTFLLHMPSWPRHAALLAALAGVLSAGPLARAQSVSSPAILQVFEARWDLVEERMADIHAVGYGRLWVPPPSKAGGGTSSVGYDMFDRFDLGSARDETRYGTDSSFRAMIDASHKAGVGVNPDLIWNHNSFEDRNNASFVAQGGYPGFAVTLPSDINGDFHDPSASGDIQGRISGLNDIAQEKDYLFIRHPTQAGNPANLPAGTVYNKPDPNNARYYPDQGLGGTNVIDGRGNPTTLYNFNADNPLAGDPVLENSVDLLMRNVRWMIQEYDIDGFRMDAIKHFESQYLQDFDTASYLAKREPLLDGSPNHVYSFGEAFDGNKGFLQSFVRRNINDSNPGTVSGNRDALDFSLFFALRDNLTSNGFANNWHTIRNAPLDTNDDGLMNGSQGVAFVQSHDSGGPALGNVAYAYTLMLPGESIVYMNADAIPGDAFPQPGRNDALGGFFGDAITKLVDIRSTHGRGDFQERWLDDAFNPSGFSNVYVYERLNSAIVGLNSRNDSATLTRNGVQTSFAPGTVLVELTGNAASAVVDPGGTIPDTVLVNGSGQIDISIPGNQGHGRGYVVYGVAGPQGSLSVGGSGVLEGTTPTSANYGSVRTTDIEVVNTPTFNVRLDTMPVSLKNPTGVGMVRDFHADGDTAILMIDGGIDLNGNGSVDNVTPGSVAYGFEEFATTRTPGYVWDGSQNVGAGAGVYEQTIDATQLSEGRHYVTARAFRHRDAATGGDGGPAVYTDFRKTIYVDLLPPDSTVESFAPYGASPNDRDLVIRSVDQTADKVHVYLDLPATTSDEDILAMVDANQNQTGYYDRDEFVYGVTGVTNGNHTVTIVTIEETGTLNIQREVGLFTDTTIGRGFGDLNFDGTINAADLTGPVGFEQLLYSQNTSFNAAADINGDGLVDNVDLLMLPSFVLSGATDTRVPDRLEQMLLRRGDVNEDDATTTADLLAIGDGLGGSDWLLDLDGNGVVELADAEVLVTQLALTSAGDFNLDGVVDAADYTVWRDNQGPGLLGDADFDGDADEADLALWHNAYGDVRTQLALSPASLAVPEPGGLLLACLAAGLIAGRRRP
ncbi:Alpha-amylase precursor [Botrimarina colliarenosi]|uniref:Alpha-amylase n=1 Tax=Botrimarina colliarenosi TaxID=2528001 RepID=A0A5C6AFB7_9BACT|nr:dockerin type I domain-containing protein [Botrimarina colliarenosi]TWT97761.1 Alpha-amylase precursor [Botrimarina colliarenosi]